MGDVTVTAVIPAWNAEAYIADAIESVLAQTVVPDEVLVVDDGSADRTQAITESFGLPVRHVIQPNRGPSAARNHGMRIARGDFICWLDADDLWHRDKTQRQLAAFDADPSLQVCLTHVKLRWDESLAAERAALAGLYRSDVVPGFATISMMARREVFGVLGPLDESLNLADAADWLVRGRDLGVPMRVLDEPLVEHRMHRSNLTRRKRQRSADEFLGMVKASLDRRRAMGKAG